jgi:hypothetical protein
MTRRLLLSLLLLVGCGASSTSPDSGGALRDAGVDAGLDGGPGVLDAGDPDAGLVDAGLPDAGGLDAGTADAGDLDAGSSPIEAPSDQWTWVDFPDSRCASGTPTGIGINPHPGATELVIYFEGGGSCRDATTCWGSDPTAANLAGYDAQTFAGAVQKNYPVLRRSLSGNPFAGMSFAYVPYCTGDLHAGTHVVSMNLPDGGVMPTHFEGALDLDLFLARLVPTFPSVTRVWLLGTSAGGYGTFLSFDRVTHAFGAGVGVDIVDDSGPAISPKNARDGGIVPPAFSIWGIVPPTGCAGCAGLSDILQFNLGVQAGFSPPGRYAFLSYLEDPVISSDYGYTLSEYADEMASYSASLPASPAAATFLESNEQSHVVQAEPGNAPAYLPWLSAMVGRDAGWSDVSYAHP